MTQPEDRLYELLPAIYRERDGELGWPLRALLQVISEQVQVLQGDVEQLYDNWFIETCQEWVIPYIGDLIGYQAVHAAGQPGQLGSQEGELRSRILTPRREVANTIRTRRRKGTLHVLAELAAAVAGWPAVPVEFYRHLGFTQSIDHLHLDRGRSVSLRNTVALERLEGPFDRTAHTVEVRRPNSRRLNGRYDIPSLGLFIWRLRPYFVTMAPAFCVEEVGAQCYTFSVLGHDSPLFNHPSSKQAQTPMAGPVDVPGVIRRRELDAHKATYYGKTNGMRIWIGPSRHPVEADQIVVADLENWAYRPRRDQVAIDPERGRIVFPLGQLPRGGVRVSYSYGFSMDMGGGEYHRRLWQPSDATVYTVQEGHRLGDALDRWRAERPVNAVVEITDSGVYAEPVSIELEAGQSLQLRAGEGHRPVIHLLDWRTDLPDSLVVSGAEGSCFVLDGILVTGRSMQVEGDLKNVTIRDCTLVPGWNLDCDCEPKRPAEPSLELNNTRANVVIERSILGTINVTEDDVHHDPIRISITDSILDATSEDREALTCPGCPIAHAVLTIRRSTVIGRVDVHSIELAENTIFDGLVAIGRRQSGCMRFCYVAPESRTPTRFDCQPDLVLAAVAESVTTAEADAVKLRERERVVPDFGSLRYGRPNYCQLALACAEEIRRGADDESEMGVFHNLFQPQRSVNLQGRLDEYTPAGSDAGLIYLT